MNQLEIIRPILGSDPLGRHLSQNNKKAAGPPASSLLPHYDTEKRGQSHRYVLQSVCTSWKPYDLFMFRIPYEDMHQRAIERRRCRFPHRCEVHIIDTPCSMYIRDGNHMNYSFSIPLETTCIRNQPRDAGTDSLIVALLPHGKARSTLYIRPAACTCELENHTNYSSAISLETTCVRTQPRDAGTDSLIVALLRH